jgi:hypothetical protein
VQFLPSFPLKNVLNLPDVEDVSPQSMKKKRIAGSDFSMKTTYIAGTSLIDSFRGFEALVTV